MGVIFETNGAGTSLQEDKSIQAIADEIKNIIKVRGKRGYGG